MKILLAVYGRDDGKLIIDFAANYGWPPGTQMKVVHVVGSCVDEATLQAAQEAAEELTGWFCGALGALVSHCELTSEILNGSPVLELLQEAANWQANMIVMGARTRDLNAVQAGSVSKTVALEAPCSVVVIRPPVAAAFNQLASQTSSLS